MFAHDFVRNAYLAGTFIALACGMVGWLVVLRAQVFAGDALSHVAFVGAIGAAVLGLDVRVGLFVLTIAVALAMAALGRRGEGDDAVIGIVFAWILGIGILLITLLATSAQGGQGIAATNTLFGSIYELGASASRIAALVGLLVAAAVAVAFRPLLLSTIDSELATIRGIRVRALGTAFLVALAVVTAESTQAVGALLLLGLLAAPGRRGAPADQPSVSRARAGGGAGGDSRCGAGSRSATRSPRCRRAARSSVSPRSAMRSRRCSCGCGQKRGPASDLGGSRDPDRRRILGFAG